VIRIFPERNRPRRDSEPPPMQRFRVGGLLMVIGCILMMLNFNVIGLAMIVVGLVAWATWR
jgi:hypothetical protein